jgi:two-component system nitrate/nitrite response regulator NarL
MAHALPGLHFIAFVPAGWPREELLGGHEARGSDEFVRLTRRELEVLQLAADGFSSPMIARELFVAVATVKTHLGNIYDKLQVRDRAAAVAKAMRLGLIS